MNPKTKIGLAVAAGFGAGSIITLNVVGHTTSRMNDLLQARKDKEKFIVSSLADLTAALREDAFTPESISAIQKFHNDIAFIEDFYG